MNVPQGHALVDVILTGTITDQSTGTPISGATVRVYPPTIRFKSDFLITKPQPIGSATTNAAGQYSILLRSLVEGTIYTVSASKTTYTTNSGEFAAPPPLLFLGPFPMTVNIALTPAPIAPIAVINGPYSGKIGDTIQFSSAGSYDPDGTITAYYWDFGDSSFSNQANPTHAYGSQQIFTVKLTVTDNSGATNTVQTTCTIAAPKDPLAEANGPYSGMVGDTLNFTSVGSSDPDGNIMEYRWDFGDGSGYSFDLNSSHVYTTDGNFTLTLRVKDDDGRTHEDTALVMVLPLPIDPIAEANGPYGAEINTQVDFSSAGSHDPDGVITNVVWNFGDGTPTSGDSNPTHNYTSTGTFTVTITVTDNSGATHSDTAIVTIVLPPNVQPLPNPNGPYETRVGDEVTLSSEGTEDPDGFITDYDWNFGDGTPHSFDQNPTHVYEADGTYTITLTVIDDRGDSASETTTITVAKKPGIPWLPILAVLIIAGAAAAYYFLVYLKKESKPTSLQVTIDPKVLPADGRSTAIVTVELLDETGSPIEATEEISVELSVPAGNVNSPIRIREEMTKASATYTAGIDIGSYTLSAQADSLKPGQAQVELTEKRRYCMHCGSQMSLEDQVCPKCGRSPPSGVDVKECPNCGEVIPIVAHFCSECGAGQHDFSNEEEVEEAPTPEPEEEKDEGDVIP
jgi:PKD repeat protein